MKITVTQEDIDNNGKSIHNCPLALCLKRTLKLGEDKYRIAVGTKTATINGETYQLPKTLINFVWDVDNKRQVKPQTFEVNWDLSRSCFI